MNKLYAKYLSIEITRRCNMSCAHCLRGDAQDVDIRHEDIRNVLKHFKSIHRLTITGGEPSLNVKAIRYILKQLKHFNIHVYDCTIVTNGSLSSISGDFIKVCSELFDYQEEDVQEENWHMLEMSDDRFHDNEHHEQVVSVLKQYPFFGTRGQSERIPLYKEGRSDEGHENPIYPIYLTETDYVYGSVYLNAEGNIVSNCDLSYQRQAENVLCRSGNFKKYLNSTLRKND